MLRFAANISFLFQEMPLLDRLDAAAEAGFEAVEILFPYEEPAKEIRRALLRNGLKLILVNAPPPNYTGGARGFAAVEGLEVRFQSDMRRAFRFCEALQVGAVHVMAGEAQGAEAKARMIDNLTWACAAAPAQMTLLIEPLSEAAMPGYFLNSYELAAEIIQAVGAPNLGVQFDSFHAQMITGDAVATFDKYRDLIRHVQIGDAPERTAPGTGIIDFEMLFEQIKASDYKGWISAEYRPAGRTADELAWMTLGS